MMEKLLKLSLQHQVGLVGQVLEHVLGQVLVWDSMQQHEWTVGFAQTVLHKLLELDNMFKYIVHVVLVENKDSAQTMNGCYSKAATVDHFLHLWQTAV